MDFSEIHFGKTKRSEVKKWKKLIDSAVALWYFSNVLNLSGCADVAQSVVRRIGSAEVTGPIPVISFFLTAEDWLVQLPLIFYQGFSHFYRREFFMEAKINVEYPVIDVFATGKNIERLRKEKGFKVKDIAMFMGFLEPQAVYKWQQGKALPSLDNMFALSVLLEVPMEEILVRKTGDSLEKDKHLAA